MKIYNDPSERSSRDLDFLIKEDQLDASIQNLESLGYELLTNFSTPKQKEAILRYYHHMELYNSKEDTLVELHWKLTSLKNFSFNLNEVWSEKYSISISNFDVRVLSDNQLITYLSLHGTLHCFFRLQWLTDLFHLFSRIPADEINRFYIQQKKIHADQFIAITLTLLNELFGLHVPQKIISDLNKRSKKIVEISQKRIIENTALTRKVSRPKTTWRNHQIQYLSGGIKGLKMSIFSRNVRPKNWQIFSFPDSVFFLNHLFSRVIWFISKLKRAEQ